MLSSADWLVIAAYFIAVFAVVPMVAAARPLDQRAAGRRRGHHLVVDSGETRIN